VRRKDARPPPMTTTASAFEALGEEEHVVWEEAFSSSSLPSNLGSAVDGLKC
jgi:hypothetical protein